MIIKKIEETSKEKHSLTRKLVGYRNWRQWWCKKKGNKIFEKRVMLNIGFLSHYPFLKILFPSFLHHHCLQFLYPTNFLVRECFSLLVRNIHQQLSLSQLASILATSHSVCTAKVVADIFSDTNQDCGQGYPS